MTLLLNVVYVVYVVAVVFSAGEPVQKVTGKTNTRAGMRTGIDRI